MKKKKTVILIALLLLILIGSCITFRYLDRKYHIKDQIYLSRNVNIEQSDLGYYQVTNEKKVSIFNMDYQNTIDKKLKKLKQADYSEKTPLLILNPYGTNTTGLYVYFKTSTKSTIEYTISVDDNSCPEYTNTLASKEAVVEHEGVIIGLIRGKKNTLTIRTKDSNGKVIATNQFHLTLPSIKTLAPAKLEMQTVQNKKELSDGLFTVLGYDFSDPGKERGIYLYDNNGILRAELPCKIGHPDYDILFLEDGYFYPIDKENYCYVSPLGKIIKKINTKGYEIHHDMNYAGDNKVAMLATKKGIDSIEDYILTVDLETGKTLHVIDFGTIMPDIKQRAKDAVDYDNLDWIHFNTVEVVNGKDMILSSRELSSIIRVNDIYTNPKIVSIISDPAIWKGTKYESLVQQKTGNFISQAGQHTVTYQEDPSLKEGQYYLYLFDNNYGGSLTFPSFDWSVIKDVNKDKFKGTTSYYVKYLVDTNTNSYKLVQKFKVPYSGIVSSVQDLDNGNIAICSGTNGTYGEYDKDGNLLIQFKMNVKMLTYRTYKYTLKGFWF